MGVGAQRAREVNKRVTAMHLTVISKHITTPCDLLPGRDDIFSCRTRSQGPAFCSVFFNVEDKPAFLFSHFPSEARAVCLSAEMRRIQPLQLKWGGGGY